jgi:hypothetical protein
MPIRLRGGGGGSAPPAEAVATRNILNGVLNCAWDKTSAAPKLLEIYDTSFVKFNIDADNPLTMAFANGWDDKDRPAQVIKTLAVAPANIDLSAKANCHVQVVAKVINGELVITTHDIYDPGWETWTDIVPNFSTYDSGTVAKPTKNGFTIEVQWPQTAGSSSQNIHNNNTSNYVQAYWDPFEFHVWTPTPVCLGKIKIYPADAKTIRFYGYDELGTWLDLTGGVACPAGAWSDAVLSNEHSFKSFSYFKFGGVGAKWALSEFQLLERPTAKFYRSLNQVKDRADAEVYWINLGYATVDASGNITALTHYTDLRNNYPGGMRVEA